MKSIVRQKLEDFYKQRAERLSILKLADVLSDTPDVYWSADSESAPEIVGRLIEKYLSQFERWWSELIQDSDFCVKAIYLRPHVDPERLRYERELGKAHTRITPQFINRFSTSEYQIHYSKLLRSYSGKD